MLQDSFITSYIASAAITMCLCYLKTDSQESLLLGKWFWNVLLVGKRSPQHAKLCQISLWLVNITRHLLEVTLSNTAVFSRAANIRIMSGRETKMEGEHSSRGAPLPKAPTFLYHKTTAHRTQHWQRGWDWDEVIGLRKRVFVLSLTVFRLLMASSATHVFLANHCF